MKQIIVQCGGESVRAALIEDGRLAEYYYERSDRRRAGNIYKGKVMNVLPGMQAAFVDIGTEKNAFLHIGDILPAAMHHRPEETPSISSVLTPGQTLLVQVAKEAVGAKGARVTTHYTLPGRSLVYMPQADYVGISRKIESERERSRLKDIGETIRRPGEGLIIRTVATGEARNTLERELESLRETWASICAQAERQPAPSLIYREPDMLPRIARDLVADDIDEIILDAEDKKREMAALLSEISPHWTGRLKVHAGEKPLLEFYGVHDELGRMFRRKLWLNSGAYLVVERTEALTVIDVNTGKYTGSVNLEETVFETNLEAAAEIARIIRLRDLSGIILIDFIDMEEEEHRQRIADELERLFKKDRTKTLVVGWTRLGLLEVTRKKVGLSLDDALFQPCSHCQGRGKVYVPPSG